MGFSGDSDSRESAYNAGDLGSIPGFRRSPGRGHDDPHPVFLPGEFHGWRSLADYSPQGRKESETTERLSTQHMSDTNFVDCLFFFFLNFLSHITHSSPFCFIVWKFSSIIFSVLWHYVSVVIFFLFVFFPFCLLFSLSPFSSSSLSPSSSFSPLLFSLLILLFFF